MGDDFKCCLYLIKLPDGIDPKYQGKLSMKKRIMNHYASNS